MQEKKKKCTELKREAIIAAAKDAFQTFGVEASSMNKIAQLAKVSKRTVYNHFKSKEILIMYLLSDVWSSALVQLDVEYDSNISLNRQLYTLLIAEVDALSSQSFIDLARVAMGHFLFEPEALQEELSHMDETPTALFRWLEAAIDDKKLKITDINYAYTQLHNMLKGSCFWPQLAQYCTSLNQEQKQRLVKDTVTMFLSLYTIE